MRANAIAFNSSPLNLTLMVKVDWFGSLARGMAIFVSSFTTLNLLAWWRRGFDANQWWIDFRPFPRGLEIVLLCTMSLLLIAWAIRPVCSKWRRASLILVLLALLVISALNARTFFRLRAQGQIASPLVVPFSMVVMGMLGVMLRAVARPPRPMCWRWAIGAGAACALLFPLLQVGAYGMTDYRRHADAILVFGARAYASGAPSDALEDRVLTAIELYHQGYAPRLIFSGGPGDGPFTEAQVMRRIALQAGVPDAAIIMDDAGLTTDAAVQNTARTLGRGKSLLAVSHGWHLPRIKLRCQRAGLVAYTVPADERGQPLRQTPYQIAREVPALWLYYLRAVVG